MFTCTMADIISRVIWEASTTSVILPRDGSRSHWTIVELSEVIEAMETFRPSDEAALLEVRRKLNFTELTPNL